MNVISVYAHMVAEIGDLDAVLSACRATAEVASAEDGCLTYHLLADTGSETTIAWFERWRDQDALDAHLQGAAAAQLGAALHGRLASPMVLHTYRDIP